MEKEEEGGGISPDSNLQPKPQTEARDPDLFAPGSTPKRQAPNLEPRL